MTLYMVIGKNFTAGFICEGGKVTKYAPILKKWVCKQEKGKWIGKSEDAALKALKGFAVKQIDEMEWGILGKGDN